MADRTLIVKLVGDEKDLLRAYSRSSRATKDFGRTTDTALGKADKRFRTLKTAGAGFAGGFITSEIIGNLTTFIDKASESEAVLTQVRQGLKNTGQSWSEYGRTIDDTVTAQSRLGFDDEELLQSFDRFNRQVRNVNQALKLNTIAMDVARGRNISLEQAANLVTKAASGQRGALTRLGIEVDKNATKVDLLRILTERYGGSAEAAADDAATAQARLGVALENVQETLGTLVLPLVSEFADELSSAAVEVNKIIAGFGKLKTAEIPVLNIPINFKLPGTDTKIGGFLKRAFGEINPLTGRMSVIGQAKTAGQLVGRITDDKDRFKRIATDVERTRAIHDRPIIVNTTVELDGAAVGRSTKKYLQGDARSNPRQKRGPNAGR